MDHSDVGMELGSLLLVDETLLLESGDASSAVRVFVDPLSAVRDERESCVFCKKWRRFWDVGGLIS